MTRILLACLCIAIPVIYSNAARILAVYPIPAISHQVALRPLTHELAKRGHEVIVITPNPAFPNTATLSNLTEIDVHDISYKIWQEIMPTSSVVNKDLVLQVRTYLKVVTLIFEKQLQTEDVQNMIRDKKDFDLLLLEDCVRPALVFSHLYKAPVILVSSLGSVFDGHSVMGSAMHPFLYAEIMYQRLYNLTMWEKVMEFYKNYVYQKLYKENEDIENEMLRRVLRTDLPKISDLKRNAEMLFLNVHPIWEDNRPVPPSVVYIGGAHKMPENDLPSDLKSYLDTSRNGFIYVSFGTNILPSLLPQDRTEVLIRVFARLPYKILLKWDRDDLPGITENIRIAKWFPQSDLLRHKKIKLFITQGGLQSTDEAIRAGVPLIGIPMFADQWYNAEKYVHHKIGLQLDIEKLTEDDLEEAIRTVIENGSYRKNIAKLRDVMFDQPQRPLERAVWWTEHVLRHGGARHLRAPTTNIPWTQYYEIELISYIISVVFALFLATFLLMSAMIRIIGKISSVKTKLKSC